MSNFASQNRKACTDNAKIAQLVEHDLAKVGVAGSSPVFRSIKKLSTEVLTDSFDVRVVELVDTLL